MKNKRDVLTEVYKGAASMVARAEMADAVTLMLNENPAAIEKLEKAGLTRAFVTAAARGEQKITVQDLAHMALALNKTLAIEIK